MLKNIIVDLKLLSTDDEQNPSPLAQSLKEANNEEINIYAVTEENANAANQHQSDQLVHAGVINQLITRDHAFIDRYSMGHQNYYCHLVEKFQLNKDETLFVTGTPRHQQLAQECAIPTLLAEHDDLTSAAAELSRQTTQSPVIALPVNNPAPTIAA